LCLGKWGVDSIPENTTVEVARRYADA